MLLGLAVAVALVALVAAGSLRLRLARARADFEQAQARETAALRESVAARRAAAASTADQQFLSRVVRALPYVIHELHGGVGRRDVPQLLLDTVVRLLEPTKALVAVARRPVVEGDPPVLAVAAVWQPQEQPEPQPQLGKALAVGEGEIGFALEVRRVLDRHDFDSQPAALRARLARDTPPEWRPDLVAPLVFKEDLAGVIALQAPSRNPAEIKDVLRLLAHLGAVALYTNARYDEMKASADTDGLTGLLNKRTIAARLADEVRMFLARGQSVSVFMFDIDHFKHYNDRNGHLAGDRLLQALTRIARAHTRPDTIFGRFGGEEFLMVFPNTSRPQAVAAAENVRLALARQEFADASSQPLGCISVSGGVAECPRDAVEPTALLRAADQALYAAKRAGRNRVVTFERHALGRDRAFELGEEPWYISWEDSETASADAGGAGAAPASAAPAANPTGASGPAIRPEGGGPVSAEQPASASGVRGRMN